MEKYYNHLIHEYLDGGLEAGEEERLFIALSGDDELRREFDKLLKISMVSGSSYSFEAPPIETSNKIFSELGFSIPTGASSAPTKKAVGLAALAALLWKAAPFAAVAVLAGAISIGAFKYLQTTDDSFASAAGKPITSKNLNNVGNSGDISQNNSNTQNGAFPQMSSFENQAGSANSPNRVAVGSGRRFYKTFATREEFEAFMLENALLAKDETSGSDDLALQNEEGDAQLVNRIEYSQDPRILRNTKGARGQSATASSIPGMIPAQHTYSPNLSLGLFESRLFSLEFRKLLINQRNLELLRNPNAFNNYSIALYYKLNGNFNVGAVVARENFPQSFIAPSGNKQTQNPTLTTFAIESRFSPEFLEVAGIALPYASVALGGSSMGPIFKYEAGVAFAPTDLFEIALGWQSDYLFYNVNGTNYIADKSGLIWGVRVNF